MSKLILIGTPIGNLGDISKRMTEAIESVDFIAAEDTRNTLKLLNHLNIKKPMISYFEHNKREKGEIIADRILNGENCALMTDAGMPAISDPGEDLVFLCHEKGIPVTAVPGPCAFITALAMSGFPTGRFTFEGFLSTNKKNRKDHLESLKNESRTMCFYEAPHKLLNTLCDMKEYFEDREICLCREITKMFEETKITSLNQAVEYYTENKPKGEFVLILKGSDKKEENPLLNLSIKEHIDFYIKDGVEKKDAIKKVAKERNLRKNEVYKETI